MSHDDTFRALSDPHRRRILSAVCESPRVAGELAGLVGLAPNAVSFHLKELKTAGLISVQRQGKYLRYHAVPAALADWREHIGRVFPLKPAAESPSQPSRHTSRSPVADRVRPAGSIYESEPLPTELL